MLFFAHCKIKTMLAHPIEHYSAKYYSGCTSPGNGKLTVSANSRVVTFNHWFRYCFLFKTNAAVCQHTQLVHIVQSCWKWDNWCIARKVFFQSRMLNQQWERCKCFKNQVVLLFFSFSRIKIIWEDLLRHYALPADNWAIAIFYSSAFMNFTWNNFK